MARSKHKQSDFRSRREETVGRKERESEIREPRARIKLSCEGMWFGRKAWARGKISLFSSGGNGGVEEDKKGNLTRMV